MNISILLERAKFSKPIIAYHGTNVRNLKSILSNGLIINHSEGWGSEEADIFGHSNNRADDNNALRDLKLKLTQNLRHILRSGASRDYAVPKNIGYKGSNRIIGFISPADGTAWMFPGFENAVPHTLFKLVSKGKFFSHFRHLGI